MGHDYESRVPKTPGALLNPQPLLNSKLSKGYCGEETNEPCLISRADQLLVCFATFTSGTSSSLILNCEFGRLQQPLP